MKYFVTIALVFLASCQETIYLVLPSEATSLGRTLEGTPSYSSWKDRVKIVDAYPIDSKASIVVSSNPSAVAKAETLRAVPKGWLDEDSYSIPASVAAYSKLESGDWASIPLFYSVWGTTVFVEQPQKIESNWTSVTNARPPMTVLAGGGSASFRQASFFFQSWKDGTANVLDWKNWFGQSSNEWKLALNEFQDFVRPQRWAPNFWRVSRADLISAYKPSVKNTIFLETYSDYETSNPGGVRAFGPLWTQNKNAEVAVAGEILFLTLHGNIASSDVAREIVRALTTKETQTFVGTKTKWLSANYRVPELNNEGAAVRKLVSTARAFFAVSDRLPDPLPENALATEIQLRVERAPQK